MVARWTVDINYFCLITQSKKLAIFLFYIRIWYLTVVKPKGKRWEMYLQTQQPILKYYFSVEKCPRRNKKTRKNKCSRAT